MKEEEENRHKRQVASEGSTRIHLLCRSRYRVTATGDALDHWMDMTKRQMHGERKKCYCNKRATDEMGRKSIVSSFREEERGRRVNCKYETNGKKGQACLFLNYFLASEPYMKDKLRLDFYLNQLKSETFNPMDKCFTSGGRKLILMMMTVTWSLFVCPFSSGFFSSS